MRDFIKRFILKLKALYNTLWGTCQTAYLGASCSHAVHNLIRVKVGYTGAPRTEWVMTHHNRDYFPYSCWIVCGFLTFHTSTLRWGLWLYRPYPRRQESLTICRCHYKGSTFSSGVEVFIELNDCTAMYLISFNSTTNIFPCYCTNWLQPYNL